MWGSVTAAPHIPQARETAIKPVLVSVVTDGKAKARSFSISASSCWHPAGGLYLQVLWLVAARLHLFKQFLRQLAPSQPCAASRQAAAMTDSTAAEGPSVQPLEVTYDPVTGEWCLCIAPTHQRSPRRAGGDGAAAGNPLQACRPSLTSTCPRTARSTSGGRPPGRQACQGRWLG